MKAKDKVLNIKKYATLKNKIYTIYINDIENPEDDKIKKLYDAIEPFNIPSVKEIVDDTIEFPYDKELASFLHRNQNMKINDFILTASNLFGIDTELVVSKIREYLSYNYIDLLDKGLIDNEKVNKISNLYLERNKEKSK